MGSITVDTTPQAIYPDGEQDSLVLYNSGPWTVYIDSDSSVNSYSQPIPPTGTIAWDFRRPIWVVAAGASSTVYLTRNSNTAEYANARDNILFKEDYQLVGTSPTFGLFECSAYETLYLRLKSNNYINKDKTAPGIYGWSYYVEIKWYSETRELIATDTLRPLFQHQNLFNPTAETPGSVCTIPIRGQLVSFSVTVFSGFQAPPLPVNIMLYGTTRSEPMRMWFDPFRATPWIRSAPTAQPTYATSDASCLLLPHGTTNALTYIALPNLGNLLTITSMYLEAVNAAADGYLQSVIQQDDAYSASLTFPTGGVGAKQSTTFRVPLSEPMEFRMIQPTATAGGRAGMRLTFNWSD